MAILDIVKYPNEILQTSLNNITNIDGELLNDLDNMAETMYKSNGIGLAANQVNINKRIITIDTEQILNKSNLYYLINPVITETHGETIYNEGCLSFPGLEVNVKRAKQICVKSLDINENEIELEASGLFAICIQHEIDHINGITFLDKLSKLQRESVIKKYKKLIK